MKAECNENASNLIAAKMKRMKEELESRPIDVENIAEVLESLHPEATPDMLYHSVQEIYEGIEQIYQTESEQINESMAQILSRQMEEMSEEQQKGYLCQLFDSIKMSDQTLDDEIEDAQVNSTNLAQMSVEELQQFVSEQLVNSVNGMAYRILEGNIEEVASMEEASLRTREDALLLAAAQYSESLEGNISFEYTKIPRVLGQCAAAQTRIVAYCESVAQSELSEDEKHDAIITFIEVILGLLACIVFGIIIGEVATALMAGTFEIITALLGTGIISFIAEIILLYPIIWVSFAVVIGAGVLVYAAVQGVCELFKAAVPKIKQWYGMLVEMLGGENPYSQSDVSEDEEWESDYMEENDLEEDNLAYT